MKTQLCSLLFIFGLSATQAQKAPDLSPAAQRLTEAYTALQQSPTDTARQKAFFGAFPKTFFELEVLFGYHPELIPANLYASGYDYTEAFRNKIPAVPVETRIDRLITLFMDGHWEADAPSYLKEELHTYADAHPLAFFRLLARHTPAEQRLFWQCFWQNPCKDPWLATALSHYKKAAARKYPRETAVMMSAYRDFAGTLEGR